MAIFLRTWSSRSLRGTVDLWFAAYPRLLPSAAAISECRLIAHRGWLNGVHSAAENTRAAFDACLDADIWGIELDIQWTADGVPMVLHDTDAGRVFGRPDVQINAVTQRQLVQQCGAIPSLEEVVERYGGKLHLMIEIKRQTFKRSYAARLKAVLGELEPVQDYHLLALDPELFNELDVFPGCTQLPVAEFNAGAMYRLAIARGYAGLAGHYLLLNRSMREGLRRRNMTWGTGYVGSANTLRRELRMGTRWIFSDHAAALNRALEAMRVAAHQ